ncbi:phage portal protein [Gluconacetobacter diazotrophicus]|uniref:phage portal protein n=1 Tax=Gluconacetobacter diazotrophicus TaxID=33996 RepID=UPI00119C82C2|nr:phage portal protein [Gluconacetobacter diazotrophicus]TWA98243.1 HK97 family phage portal protein [Gluconacetobacter diazotrophicus]
MNQQIEIFKKALNSSIQKSLLPSLDEPSFAYGGGSFFVGGNITGTGVYITPQTTRQISAATACINILTQDVSRVPFRVEQYNKTSGWAPLPDDAPLGYLTKFPNNRHTMREIFRQCVEDLLMNGNAYIVVIRDSDSTPKEFIYVNYNTVSVIENEDGELIYTATHKMFKNKKTSLSNEDGYTRTIHYEDMIHLKKNVINGEYIGRGIIYTSSEPFGLALAAQETAARTFNNGCTIPGFLRTATQVNEETASRIKTKFMESQGGVSKSGGVGVLNGVDFVKIGLSPAEVQLENARDYQRSEIASMLRVPLFKFSIVGEHETSTLEQMELSYIHNTLSFYTTLIEEEFNRKVFQREDARKLRFHFDFTEVAIPDFKSRMEAWSSAKNSGFVTSDYVALRENFPEPGPDGGGDKYVLPQNMGVVDGVSSMPLGLSEHTDHQPVNEQESKVADEVNI